MAIKIPLHLFSHHRKIANCYKKWVRALEAQYRQREIFRYEATLARAEFNAIYYEKDMRKSKQMLQEKEDSLENFKYQLFSTHPTSPGGNEHQKHVFYEDWILDLWHPLEKAIYPDYFARRELRKQQFIEMWNRQHGPPKPQH